MLQQWPSGSPFGTNGVRCLGGNRGAVGRSAEKCVRVAPTRRDAAKRLLTGGNIRPTVSLHITQSGLDNMRFFIAAYGVIAALTSTAFAQDMPARMPDIATTGRGEISIRATHAILTVMVENNASSAATAGGENARLVASTMKSLRAAGVKDAELTNGGYSLNQDFENGDRRRPRGFVARNSIRIDVPRVDEVGKLIDAALAGGATLVSPIQYLGNDMTNARRDALKAAVAEATRDAQTLAEAAGGTLGRLISMSTGIGNPVYPRLGSEVVATALASSGFPETSIRPNDIIVTAMASGRWEFVPRR